LHVAGFIFIQLFGVSCLFGNEVDYYKTFISPAQPIDTNDGVVTHEHYLTLNFKKKKIKEPGRPMLESKTNYPMYDNFILGLEPKNNIPTDPNGESWAEYELSRICPSGTFIVLLHIWNFRYADKSTSKLTVEANGESFSYDFPFVKGKYKGKGYKWIPFSFKSENQFRKFKVLLAPPPDAPFIIKKIFITNNESDIEKLCAKGGEKDFILKDSNPFAEKQRGFQKTHDRSAKNLIPGSDFETGFGYGWRSLTHNYLYNERTSGSAEGFESSRGMSPVGAMGSFNKMVLASNLINVKESDRYVLSYYAKSITGKNSKITSQVRSGKKYYRLFPADKNNNFSDVISKQWIRYSHEVNISSKRVAVIFVIPDDSVIDKVQLEKGSLSSYSQAFPVETGVKFYGSHTHAYRLDEPINADILVCARDKSMSAADILAEVTDYYGEKVWSRKIRVPLVSATGSVSLNLQNNIPGIYKLTTRWAGSDYRISECVFTNHILPEKYSMNYPSAVGFYSALSHSSLESLKKSHMNHAISFSCYPQTGHWHTVGKGPTAGDIIFYDEYVDLCRKYGIELSVNIDYRPKKNTLTWLKKRPGSNVMPADMNDWKIFLETLTAHYKDRVSAWLILDDLSHYFSSAEYKEFVKVAKDVHDRIVPDSKFIAWIYNYPNPYFDSKLTEEESEKYGEYFSRVTDILFMAGRKMNKEFSGRKECRRYFHGGAGDSFYNKISTKFDYTGKKRELFKYLKSTNSTIKRAVHEFSYYNIDRLQYYSARTPPDPKSIYHFDGTFTPAGHAFSVLNHFMRGKKMFKKHFLPGLTVNEFRDRGNHSFLTIWSSTGEPVEIFLKNVPSDLELRNLTGAVIEPEKIKTGIKFLVKNEVIYMKSGNSDYERILNAAVLKNITPFGIFLTASGNKRKLKLHVGIRNRTTNSQNLVMHFDPTGVNWKSGKGDFHDDLVKSIDNYDKVLEPGEKDSLSYEIRYIPGQEYVNRSIKTIIQWLGQQSTIETPVKSSYASRIAEKKKITADVKTLLKRNRFNRIGGIDLSVRHPAAKNEIDVRCFPRWDNKNIYFTCRIISKGFVLGNPRNIVNMFVNPDPVKNWSLPFDKKKIYNIIVDLNNRKAVLKGGKTDFELDCLVKSTKEELVAEWSVSWQKLGLISPERGQLCVMGINFSFLTASAVEEYFYPWMPWYDRNNTIPDSFGYLILGD
jgi:hypothetical protein